MGLKFQAELVYAADTDEVASAMFFEISSHKCANWQRRSCHTICHAVKVQGIF